MPPLVVIMRFCDGEWLRMHLSKKCVELIRFAGGLQVDAYKENIQVTRIIDEQRQRTSKLSDELNL